jgi:excisionase family DNA binding protein
MTPMVESALLRHMKNQDEAIAALTAEVQLLRNVIEGKIQMHQFLTFDEAAQMLKICRTTLQKRLKDGEYPWAVQKGRKWLFPYEKLKKCV